MLISIKRMAQRFWAEALDMAQSSGLKAELLTGYQARIPHPFCAGHINIHIFSVKPE